MGLQVTAVGLRATLAVGVGLRQAGQNGRIQALREALKIPHGALCLRVEALCRRAEALHPRVEAQAP